MLNGSAVDVLRAMIEMFSTGDVSGVDDVVAADYLDHQGLGGGELRGVDGFVQVVTAARRPYSVLRVELVEVRATADRVEGRLHWRGVLDDGTMVQRETIETVRVVDGLAIEHWGTHL